MATAVAEHMAANASRSASPDNETGAKADAEMVDAEVVGAGSEPAVAAAATVAAPASACVPAVGAAVGTAGGRAAAVPLEVIPEASGEATSDVDAPLSPAALAPLDTRSASPPRASSPPPGSLPPSPTMRPLADAAAELTATAGLDAGAAAEAAADFAAAGDKEAAMSDDPTLGQVFATFLRPQIQSVSQKVKAAAGAAAASAQQHLTAAQAQLMHHREGSVEAGQQPRSFTGEGMAAAAGGFMEAMAGVEAALQTCVVVDLCGCYLAECANAWVACALSALRRPPCWFLL